MDNFKQFYESDLNLIFKNESKRAADSLTDQYIDQIFENPQNEKITIKYSGLELNDINQNLTILKYQMEFLERLGIKGTIPCLAIGETKIPIDIFQYFDDREKRLSILPDFYDDYYNKHFYIEERIYRLLNRIEKSSNEYLTNQSVDSIRSNIKIALSSFLEMRYASFFNQNILSKISQFFRGGSPPSISSGVSSKYLTVTVNTNNHGLDLSASPAYFVTWKKFGSPTSPIAGYLIPGTYIFGGSGIGLPTFTFDSTPVDIPPNLDVTITKF